MHRQRNSVTSHGCSPHNTYYARSHSTDSQLNGQSLKLTHNIELTSKGAVVFVWKPRPVQYVLPWRRQKARLTQAGRRSFVTGSQPGQVAGQGLSLRLSGPHWPTVMASTIRHTSLAGSVRSRTSRIAFSGWGFSHCSVYR